MEPGGLEHREGSHALVQSQAGLRIPSSLGGLSLASRGLQLIGRGPPTARRRPCFTQRLLIQMLLQKKKRFHRSIRAGVGPNPWVPRPGPAEPRSCGPLVTEAPTAPPHAVLALTVRALGTLAGSPRASGRPAFGLSPSSCRWPNPHTLALSSVTGPANGSSPTRGGRRAPAARWDGVVGHLGTCPCDWI